MFDVGDYIIYGCSGVCKVENIGPVEINGVSKDKMYYTLAPVYNKGSKVYTPTDNEKVIMRPILSSEEAITLIDHIQEIGTLQVVDEKRGEEVYKEALQKNDCREWIKIIKTIYLRKQAKINQGKKLTACEERYFHLAEDCLYEELAIPLEIKKDEVEEFIIERVNK